MSRSLRLKAPAKVNLTLEALAKRPDGYHEVRMLMVGIDLCDELSVRPAKTLTLSCDRKGLDLGMSNLVMKAALALRQATGCTLGAQIHLKKHIPLGGGLAGGSTDAAAALKALNRLWRTRLSPLKLERLAATLGSDVPFCLGSGWAVATGRGERLRALKPPQTLHLVLLNPGFQVSTPWVYQNLKLGPRSRVNFTQRAFGALARKDLKGLKLAMVNHLEPVTSRRHPQIQAMERVLESRGALLARMSGSGPTVMGLFKNATEAKKAARALKSSYPLALAVKSIGRLKDF